MIVRSVRLAVAARRDINRLVDFLAERNELAATKAGELIINAVLSLATLSERGHLAVAPDWRELFVRFGRGGYVIRYRVVDDKTVVVTRIFHNLERR